MHKKSPPAEIKVISTSGAVSSRNLGCASGVASAEAFGPPTCYGLPPRWLVQHKSTCSPPFNSLFDDSQSGCQPEWAMKSFGKGQSRRVIAIRLRPLSSRAEILAREIFGHPPTGLFPGRQRRSGIDRRNCDTRRFAGVHPFGLGGSISYIRITKTSPPAKEFSGPAAPDCDVRLPVTEMILAPLLRIQRLICRSISGISESILMKTLICCIEGHL
jgi:hypothetical protein